MKKITAIGIVSLAKVMGMSGVLAGLIPGVIWGGLLLVGGVSAQQGAQGQGLAALGAAGAAIVMLGFPLAYGAACFVGGLIHGVILNTVLGLSGGLELELRDA